MDNFKVANFEKVSLEQFKQDCEFHRKKTHVIFDNKIEYEEVYKSIKLPERKTPGSAGHDFVLPYDIDLKPGEEMCIPTGIKCNMMKNVVLMIYPRSSLGIKYKLSILNTVGVIDADYYNNPDNEGHILVFIKNNGNQMLKLKQGTSFVQGVFTIFGTAGGNTENMAERSGGIGSTGA